ncbi:Nucleoside-diphosphate-sugar epimerase [Saccharicrinis carchari]|uniref:Nucleoside-diphosphate-sugar epimerase n=1 Tax=Saccharicrinis carchari TaxID=1168039 RepID=A0A521DFU3_SACCC|nr:NAD-dependent epimerase/dehydratase family protein [Saccharicrinis carchari]SMO70455.1 Nucleoside-diphosphate-sugar epimerase [Saccharicrinis carchari]
MILVTGGTGLVGAHLLYHLLLSGSKVRALKRSSSNINKTRFVFEFYGDETLHLFEEIEWIEGDLLDYESLELALADAKTVYHTGALVSFNPSLRNHMMEVNEEGTANLVNACVEKGVEKFCYVSSIATLGNSKNGETIDEFSYWQGGKNHSAYSLSKFRAEMQVWRATKEGLNAIVVNPSVILGPGNWKQGSLKIIDTVYKGLLFYTSGGTGFVDVRDVVSAMIKLTKSNAVNERFILNGANLSFKSLFAQIAQSLQVRPPKFRAGAQLVGIAWRYEWLKNFLFGTEPLITKDSARSSLKRTVFSGALISKTIDFDYTPIEKTIKDTTQYYLNTKQ